MHMMKPALAIFACGVSLASLAPGLALAQESDDQAAGAPTDSRAENGHRRDARGSHSRRRGSDRRHRRDMAETGARDTGVSTIIVTGRNGSHSYSAQSGVGSKVKEDPREIPQSIAVISRQRMEDQNIRTSTEALAQVPGFNSTNPEGFFTLRGFSTSVTVDGAPSGSIAGRTDVDVEVFEQIEVLKGAASLMQGQAQPGGVVNYVFKKPTSRFAASAKIGAGSFNNFYGGVDVGGPLTKDRSLRFRGVAFYEDRDLYTRPEHRERFTLYGTLQYDITPRTTASVGYHRQKSSSNEGFRQGLPTYTDGTLLDVSPRTSLSQDWWRWDKLSTSWLADIEHRFGGEWIAKIAWRRGRAELPSVVSYPGSSGVTTACATAVPGAGAFLTNAAQGNGYAGVVRGSPYGGLRCMNTQYYNDKTGTNSIEGWLSGPFDLMGVEQKLLVGYNRREELFSRAPFVNAGAEQDYVVDIFNPNPHVRDRVVLVAPGNPPYTKTIDEGIYGRLTLSPVSWLKFPIGGRISWVKDSSGRKIASGEVTPYFGVVADVTREVSFYASYVESFVPPSATVRIWTGDGQQGDMAPPVTGEQYEAGAKASLFGGRLQASAAYFRITRKNSTSTDTAHPATGGVSYVILTGERLTKGFEAQLNGEILPNLSVGLAYAYTDAKVSKDLNYLGQIVDGTPRHALNLWTNYKVTEGAFKGFSAGGGVRAQSRIRGGFSCRTGLAASNPGCAPRIIGPGYVTVSLRAGYAFAEHFDITLNADNLLNKRYWQSVGSRSGQNYLGAPRTVQLTLRARY